MQHFVHVFCAKPADGYNEGYGQKLNCSRCLKQKGMFLYDFSLVSCNLCLI
jgi:hypothetical protein